MNETLVIHVNAFTHKIEGGYTVDSAALARFDRFEATRVRPVRRFISAIDIGAFIASNPETPVKFLEV